MSGAVAMTERTAIKSIGRVAGRRSDEEHMSAERTIRARLIRIATD
jgi:hypothetical protein